MVTLWRGRHMVTTGDDDTSVTCHVTLSGDHSPCDAISSHSHHIPHTSSSQAKSLPEIFASNSSDHCCLTRLGITKCFKFFDIPAIAFVILALAVKITTLYSCLKGCYDSHFHYNLQLLETMLSRPAYLFVLYDLRGVAPPCSVQFTSRRV